MTPALVLMLCLSAPPQAGAKADKEQDEAPAVKVKPAPVQFAAKLPRGFKLISTTRKGEEIKQTLKMPNGVEVSVEYEAVEPPRFAFFIKAPTVSTKTVGGELVAVAKRVLPLIPMASGSTADTRVFLKALEDASINTMPAVLPCEPALCQLSLVPFAAETKKKKEAKPPSPLEEGPAMIKLAFQGAAASN